MFATPQSRFIFGSIPWYSALIATGILFALWWASREEKRLALPADTMVDLALRLIPWGIIGARLYYVAFAWDTFRDNPVSILYIWQGGLAIYGALIAGFIAGLLYCRKRKVPFFRVLDAIVPGLAMAQAIGRWGNYFNMEAYGMAITDPALQFFPLAVFIPGGSAGSWHMATFFYESVWNLMVFATLALLRRHARRDGDLLCWYMLLYGAGRLVIEELRLDSLMASTLRVSQLLSSVLCMVVLVLFISRIPRMRTPRTLWSTVTVAIVWLAVGMGVSLGSVEHAFTGHNALLPMMVALTIAACILLLEEKRWLQAVPAIALAAASLLVKIWLPDDALSATAMKLLHCGLFAMMPVAACSAAYPLTAAIQPDHTAASRA